MNRMSIIKIFELSGIATIILSLVFIVYEIRQANTIAMIEAEQGIQGSFSAVNELIIENIMEIAYVYVYVKHLDFPPKRSEIQFHANA